ncbi:MAG: rhamnulokinase [Deltaproteobacteria bacterium]|nr:rhamnulokinase [Deltaproteobacteria bacterium]
MEHIAVDIGASGGRLFSGKVISNGSGPYRPVKKIEISDVYRFDNRIIERDGQSLWDIDLLFHHIVRGLHEAFDRGCKRCTVGIDTWGVDYVLIDQSCNRVSDVFSYRDSRTRAAMDAFLNIIPREVIYSKTGIQFLRFNTIYQLYSHDQEVLKKTWKIMLIPDYLYFLFTGKCHNEVTNASTTQLLNLDQRDFDGDLLATLGIERGMFADLIKPGRYIGPVKPGLMQKYSLPECEFITVATHDTGSAVLGTPLSGDNSVYLSCGTWSLMGVENNSPVNSNDALRHNFTNEWGASGTYRFLKNLTGLWLVQGMKRALPNGIGYAALMKMAGNSRGFSFIINPNDESFMNPPDMIETIKKYCKETGQGAPDSEAELIRCILDSLSLSYRHTIEEIEHLTGRNISVINLTGGGVNNTLLCRLTSNVTGKRLLAGPVEATILGNLIMQMIASGEIADISEARAMIKESFDPVEYLPQKMADADDAFKRYKENILRR